MNLSSGSRCGGQKQDKAKNRKRESLCVTLCVNKNVFKMQRSALPGESSQWQEQLPHWCPMYLVTQEGVAVSPALSPPLSEVVLFKMTEVDDL